MGGCAAHQELDFKLGALRSEAGKAEGAQEDKADKAAGGEGESDPFGALRG